MQIGGLQKLTLIDYPEKIACVVFLVGCNFQCPFCYSKELVLPKEIKKQPKISEKDFFDFLKKRKGLIEGVCITGGEPTINGQLSVFIKKIKKFGYLIKLDTNGSNPESLKNLIDQKLINYIAMDVKAPFGVKNQGQTPRAGSDPAGLKYEKATGVKINLDNIKKSVEIIKSSGIDYEFRTTIVPTIHTKEDIIQIAKEISPAKRYYLQNFRPEKTIDSKFEKIIPLAEDDLKRLEKKCNQYIKTELRI